MITTIVVGNGTTGLVADRLQRHCIGIELNPAYAEIARRRIQRESPLLAEMIYQNSVATPRAFMECEL